MTVKIALFRGINVGGRNSLPMRELKAIIEDCGGRNTHTYIQSGNAAFQHDANNNAALGERISDDVEARKGFRPQVLVLDREHFERLVGGNPYPEATDDPKGLHLFVLTGPVSPNTEKMEELRKPSERFLLTDEALYLHAPDGIGRSKLVEQLERLIGVPATGRNWRSVLAISDMAVAVARGT